MTPNESRKHERTKARKHDIRLIREMHVLSVTIGGRLPSPPACVGFRARKRKMAGGEGSGVRGPFECPKPRVCRTTEEPEKELLRAAYA
jgi:hypothetical protein